MPASQTVAISDIAIELKRQGVPVLSLAVGEPDFQPPPEVMAAAHSALDAGIADLVLHQHRHECSAQRASYSGFVKTMTRTHSHARLLLRTAQYFEEHEPE